MLSPLQLANRLKLQRRAANKALHSTLKETFPNYAEFWAQVIALPIRIKHALPCIAIECNFHKLIKSRFGDPNCLISGTQPTHSLPVIPCALRCEATAQYRCADTGPLPLAIRQRSRIAAPLKRGLSSGMMLSNTTYTTHRHYLKGKRSAFASTPPASTFPHPIKNAIIPP